MATEEVTLFQEAREQAEARQAARVVVDRLRDVENGLTGFAAVVETLSTEDKVIARAWALTLPGKLQTFIESLGS